MAKKNQASYTTNIEAAIAAARAPYASVSPYVSNNRTKQETKKKVTQKLNALNSQAQNLRKEYDTLKRQVSATEKAISKETNPTFKNALRGTLAKLKTERDKKYDQLTAKEREIKEFTKKNNVGFAPKPDAKTKPKKPSGPTITATSGKAIFPYQYNAPLIRDAYFNPLGIQAKTLDQSTINFASYEDARKAWKNAKPGKGAIQMDKKFTQGQIEGFKVTDSTVKLDLQMYGFRFLYNPKEVTMGWTTQGAVDPTFAPQDEALPISSGLMSSVVTFNLLLNRIGDMDYLDKNGIVSQKMKEFSSTQAGITADMDPAQRNRMYSANFASKFPYPETVSIDDQVEIWNKGTMYDLEYLFKVLNGPAATFKNTFGIQTADRAYMRLSIVELHLGNNLRYRVRVSDMDVNHTIFNDRMVPIFTTVRLTCQRFIDSPVVSGSSQTSSTLSAPPHDAAMRGSVK